jgi:hypothetical protein
MNTWRGYVGRTSDGDRLWLEIELRVKSSRGFKSITHDEIGDYTELSIQGGGLYKGHRTGRDTDFGGQCVDFLRNVTRPEKGFTVAELQRIADVWVRWHLNGMRAGCAHQSPVLAPDKYGNVVPSLELTPACPETGYKYGHAWLVESLPADIETEVRAFADRLDGTYAC